MGLRERIEQWKSESETRGDGLGRRSNRRKSSADLPTLPDLPLLLRQLLTSLLLAPLLLKVDSLALILSEGVRRVLVISSPDDVTFFVCTILN